MDVTTLESAVNAIAEGQNLAARLQRVTDGCRRGNDAGQPLLCEPLMSKRCLTEDRSDGVDRLE
jgi:hypothetical protein